MPTNALDNPLVLPILGLLVEEPRHAYAVFAELRRRYTFLTVRNATVYTLLSTLTGTGWVEAVDTGQRPTLATTADGRAAFATKVDEQLRTATDSTAFMTALAYLGILTPAEAVEALRERITFIKDERLRLARLMADAGASELHMIEVHFHLDQLAHETTWLRRTIERIDAGDLAWPARA